MFLGHNYGMGISKLDRESPAHSLLGNLLHYVRERILRRLNQMATEFTGLFQLRMSSQQPPGHGIFNNLAEQPFLVMTKTANLDHQRLFFYFSVFFH